MRNITVGYVNDHLINKMIDSTKIVTITTTITTTPTIWNRTKMIISHNSNNNNSRHVGRLGRLPIGLSYSSTMPTIIVLKIMMEMANIVSYAILSKRQWRARVAGTGIIVRIVKIHEGNIKYWTPISVTYRNINVFSAFTITILQNSNHHHHPCRLTYLNPRTNTLHSIDCPHLRWSRK